MRTVLTILLLLGYYQITAQTDGRKVVPGTKYSLLPPDGFVLMEGFSGFQNSRSGASIILAEIPISLQESIAGFTADALKSKGMTLLEKDSVDFNNSKAIILKVNQNANGALYLKQILLFGDDRKTVMVSGIYPETSKGVEVQIRSALLSTHYNDKQTENPLELVPFSISVVGTPFKLGKYFTGSLLYTADGKVPTKATDKAIISVGSSLSKEQIIDKRQFAIQRLKQLPNAGAANITIISEETIDNLDGLEITANRTETNGKKELLYQLVLFEKEGGYYIIAASASARYAANLKNFKSIARTFKKKRYS